MGGYPAIQVLVDDRERGGAAARALEAHPGVLLRYRRLRVGDFVVNGTLLVERKTLPDLVASIEDGRLFRQAAAMAGQPLRSALILEGRALDLGMKRQAIQGALLTVTLGFGIPVLRALDGAETAGLLVMAADQAGRAARGLHPRPGRRPGAKRRAQAWVLQGLPGVGPFRAERLLAAFGDVASILTADPAQLADVPGIGPGIAAGIAWVARERPPAYRG